MDSIRLVLRLGVKESDILLLAKQYNIKELIIKATENYLNQSEDRIALPPFQEVEPKTFNLRFQKSDSIEAFELLQSIPDGYRILAVKMLIRHYVSQCDLRFFTNKIPLPKMKNSVRNNNPSKTIPNQTDIVPNQTDIVPNQTINTPKNTISNVPTSNPQRPQQSLTTPPIINPFLKSNNEDDIFSLI